jgi:hypothetical protein
MKSATPSSTRQAATAFASSGWYLNLGIALVLLIPIYAHYFKGDWRRIYVDDLFPVDSEQRLLLPVSSISGELWPLIVSKALCKVLAASYELRSDLSELGDTSVLHALTGWLPEATPLTSR